MPDERIGAIWLDADYAAGIMTPGRGSLVWQGVRCGDFWHVGSFSASEVGGGYFPTGSNNQSDGGVGLTGNTGHCVAFVSAGWKCGRRSVAIKWDRKTIN